jgi:hypothetical protein
MKQQLPHMLFAARVTVKGLSVGTLQPSVSDHLAKRRNMPHVGNAAIARQRDPGVAAAKFGKFFDRDISSIN